MDKHERAYRQFYGLDDDELIDEDELVQFDPENPPRGHESDDPYYDEGWY